MSSALEALICCVIVPAAVAMGLGWTLQRLIRLGVLASTALSLGIAAGFFAGYVLVTPWDALLPRRHWQWLPYLAVVAPLMGVPAASQRVKAPLRWILFLALAGGGALLLVPTWPTLQPPRPAMMALLAAYLTLLMGLLDALPDPLTGSFLLVPCVLATTVVALLVGAEVSITYGKLASVAAAAIGGGYLAALLSKRAQLARGAIPILAILAGGLAFLGAIEPAQPAYGILVAPLAPLMLWCFACGPFAKLRGSTAMLAQATALLIPLLIAAVLVLLRSTAYE